MDSNLQWCSRSLHVADIIKYFTFSVSCWFIWKSLSLYHHRRSSILFLYLSVAKNWMPGNASVYKITTHLKGIKIWICFQNKMISNSEKLLLMKKVNKDNETPSKSYGHHNCLYFICLEHFPLQFLPHCFVLTHLLLCHCSTVSCFPLRSSQLFDNFTRTVPPSSSFFEFSKIWSRRFQYYK